MSEDIVAYTPENSNPLIPTANHSIGDTQQTAVNGRDLHAFLGARRDYSTWVKAQITRGRFVEGRDYGIFPQKGENSLRGRPLVDYIFTVDAAKQIGMLSGTERGVQIREYFLACEKRVYQLESPPQPTPHEELADPILRHMAQIDRIVEQLLSMDELRRNIQLHILKDHHGLDLFAGFNASRQIENVKRPDPKKCKSIIDLLDKKRYMHPSRLWRTWLVNLDIIYPLDSYDAVPELTPSGKEIAYIDWLDSAVGLPKPDIKMDEEAFERLHSTSLPNGRVYNDNHGW